VETCFHHKDRETGRACTRCGRPACVECLHDAPVGSHCFECIRAARPPARERARRWNAAAGVVATKVLIATNVLAYVLIAASAAGGRSGGNLEARLVLFGPAVASGQWYRMVTTGFVHFGLLHLAFNMLLLYRLGLILEPALGRLRFAMLYGAALLAGSFGALLLTPHVATGGASGAVFGLLGAVAVGMRQRGISLRETGIRALLVLNLLFTVAVPGISIGGHLGGLAGGAAVGWVMLRSPSSRRGVLEGSAAAVVVACLALVGAAWAAHG
jgi:membrane associated rhomboid family serine protease